MEPYPQKYLSDHSTSQKLLVRLGGPALSCSDVQAIMSRSPHGAELMGWLNEALACEAEEADPLLQKYTLEEEEINM